MVKVLDSQIESPKSKTTGWFKGRLCHHPSMLNQKPGTLGYLVVQSKLSPNSGSVALRQLNPIHTRCLDVFYYYFYLCSLSSIDRQVQFRVTVIFMPGVLRKVILTVLRQAESVMGGIVKIFQNLGGQFKFHFSILFLNFWSTLVPHVQRSSWKIL